MCGCQQGDGMDTIKSVKQKRRGPRLIRVRVQGRELNITLFQEALFIVIHTYMLTPVWNLSSRFFGM